MSAARDQICHPAYPVHLHDCPCGIKSLILGSTDILLDFEEFFTNERAGSGKFYIFLLLELFLSKCFVWNFAVSFCCEKFSRYGSSIYSTWHDAIVPFVIVTYRTVFLFILRFWSNPSLFLIRLFITNICDCVTLMREFTFFYRCALCLWTVY